MQFPFLPDNINVHSKILKKDTQSICKPCTGDDDDGDITGETKLWRAQRKNINILSAINTEVATREIF